MPNKRTISQQLKDNHERVAKLFAKDDRVRLILSGEPDQMGLGREGVVLRTGNFLVHVLLDGDGNFFSANEVQVGPHQLEKI